MGRSKLATGAGALWLDGILVGAMEWPDAVVFMNSATVDSVWCTTAWVLPTEARAGARSTKVGRHDLAHRKIRDEQLL